MRRCDFSCDRRCVVEPSPLAIFPKGGKIFTKSLGCNTIKTSYALLRKPSNDNQTRFKGRQIVTSCSISVINWFYLFSFTFNIICTKKNRFLVLAFCKDLVMELLLY